MFPRKKVEQWVDMRPEKPKTRPKSTKVPSGCSNLGQVFGARVRQVRKARGLTRELAAQQLHIRDIDLGYIEQGRVLPNPTTIKRIYSWLFEGKSFANAAYAGVSRLSLRDEVHATPAEHKKININIPLPIWNRLDQAAQRAGCAPNDLLFIALEHFLDNSPTMTLMSEIILRYRRAALSQIITECPEIAFILEGDLELMVSMGAKLTCLPINQIKEALAGQSQGAKQRKKTQAEEIAGTSDEEFNSKLWKSNLEEV